MLYAKNKRSPTGSIRPIFIRRHAFGVSLWRRLKITRIMKFLLSVTK
ncbi:hypothetical protein AAZX31_09G093400 [Glycine max]